jgi:hypothetical protein
MSTRSMIGIIDAFGGVKAIYCHFDGYLSYVGAMLREHYADHAAVTDLIALGDLSSLDATIGTTTAYGRDCGESDTAAKQFASEAAVIAACKDGWAGTEYLYLWSQDAGWRWMPRNGAGLRKLTAAAVNSDRDAG